MRYKPIITLWCIMLALASPAWGHSRGMAGASLVPSVAYDFDSDNFGKGLELSLYLAYLNIGAGYRSWNDDVLDDKKKPFQNETRLYLGLGLFNLLQVQGGIPAGNKTITMRIKSELPWRILLGEGDFDNLGIVFSETNNPNIIISPYYETDFKDRNIIGFCLGLLFK